MADHDVRQKSKIVIAPFTLETMAISVGVFVPSAAFYILLRHSYKKYKRAGSRDSSLLASAVCLPISLFGIALLIPGFLNPPTTEYDAFRFKLLLDAQIRLSLTVLPLIFITTKGAFAFFSWISKK